MRYNLVLMLFALLMTSCTAAKAVVAMNRSTSQFIALEQDKRVLYEQGAKEHAVIISNELDSAVNTVEQKQYKTFIKPVTIYICNSIESFTDYCLQSKASGCVINERLFLSPKAFQAKHQVLTHELSHLHMEQQLGLFDWVSGYPVWFQEGLAVYVSNGEGANRVAPEEARKAMAKGKTFAPNLSGSLLFRKTAYSFDLKPNMFYRQAGMFVEYLHNIDEKKFKTFLLSIEAGENFEKSFLSAYGVSLSETWEQFIQKFAPQGS